MLYNVVIEPNPFNLKRNGIGRNHRETKVTHLSNIVYNKVSLCQVNIAKASSVYCSAIFSSQDKYHHTHKLPEREQPQLGIENIVQPHINRCNWNPNFPGLYCIILFASVYLDSVTCIRSAQCELWLPIRSEGMLYPDRLDVTIR